MKDLKELESVIKMLMRTWAEEKIAQEDVGKIRYAGPVLGAEEYSAIMTALFDNWWSGGKHTISAEKKLAQISNRNHALLLNSGSSANLVLMEAVRNLYLNQGDKVLTLACGFPTTVNAIIKSGLTPVLADIDLETLNINPQVMVEAAKKENIKAVFLPHTLGFKNYVDELLDAARELNLIVLFDACDAYGTKYKGNPIQNYGKAATLSFYVAHHMTMGEGGAVVTNDDDLARVMKGMRNWGKYCASDNCCIRSVDPSVFCPTTRLTLDSPIPNDHPVSYIYEWIGYNLKPLEIQSAMLSCQMDKLDGFNQARKKNYTILYDYFKKSKIPFKIWDMDEDTSPFSFPMIIPKEAPFIRKHFIDFLKRNKVETRVIFGGNLMRHPAYYKNEGTCIQYGDLINSNTIMEQALMLGVSHVNSEDTTLKMVDIIDEFLKKY